MNTNEECSRISEDNLSSVSGGFSNDYHNAQIKIVSIHMKYINGPAHGFIDEATAYVNSMTKLGVDDSNRLKNIIRDLAKKLPA